MDISSARNKLTDLGFRNLQSHHDKDGKLLVQFGALPSENATMTKSPFHSNESDFIHFTSIENLISILNTKRFRLYNLINMDDKSEIKWANDQLKFKSPVNNELLEHIYCFSMCEANIIDNNQAKENLLWKLHGRDGNGIMLKLRIVNDTVCWHNYHLIKVKYNIDDAISVQYINEHDIQTKLDQKICSFIKNPIYNFEEETRIIFENRKYYKVTVKEWERILYPITIPDKLHKKENILYFEIPVFNFYREHQDCFKAPSMLPQNYELPKIEITEIILGYRNSEEDESILRGKIKLIDNRIKVYRTELAKNY